MIDDYTREKIERAIADARHPRGMSIHDGKVRIDVGTLERLLTAARRGSTHAPEPTGDAAAARVDGYLDQHHRDSAELRRLCAERDAARADVKRLQADLEIERMRLVACGVVALANTPDSAAEARRMHPDYRSVSLDDVERIVDQNMQLRAEALETLDVLARLVADIDDLVDASDGVYGLHRTGNLSPWGEILYRGSYERLTALYLTALYDARELLSKRGEK